MAKFPIKKLLIFISVFLLQSCNSSSSDTKEILSSVNEKITAFRSKGFSEVEGAWRVSRFTIDGQEVCEPNQCIAKVYKVDAHPTWARYQVHFKKFDNKSLLNISSIGTIDTLYISESGKKNNELCGYLKGNEISLAYGKCIHTDSTLTYKGFSPSIGYIKPGLFFDLKLTREY